MGWEMMEEEKRALLVRTKLSRTSAKIITGPCQGNGVAGLAFSHRLRTSHRYVPPPLCGPYPVLVAGAIFASGRRNH